MISTRGKIRIIAVLIGLVFWAGAFKVVFAGGLDEVAIYMSDRGMCKLYVPQAWVNEALIRASLERGITIDQARWQAAAMSVAIDQAAKDLGKVREYCAARAAPTY